MKSLIVYYTWSGKTKGMAEIIARLTGADLLEIKPETPYATDYNKVVEQAKKEIREGYRPIIAPVHAELELYHVIYIGTPIWWGTMAPPLAAFLEEHDFGSKIIMPFSTHGGGGKGHSGHDRAKLCHGAQLMEMYTAYEGGGRTAEKEIFGWIQKNKLI